MLQVELQYLHDYAGISTSVGLTANPIVNFSAVIGTNVLSLGTDLSFDSKSGNFTKCNAGLSFNNADLIASLNLWVFFTVCICSFERDLLFSTTVLYILCCIWCFLFFFLQKSLSFEKPIVYQNSQTLCLANWLTFLWLDFWSFLFDISYLHEIHDNDGLLMTFLGPYLNGLLRGLFEMIKYMIRHSSCLD